MIDQKAKTDHLEKVLESSGFAKSRRFKELLRYLVNAELEGIPVKEITLAIDLFGKDASFDPAEETIVRVSIGNIRKKLTTYYFTEGSSDTIRMEIPKGSYNLVFKTVKPSQIKFWNIQRKSLFFLTAFLFGACLIAVLILGYKNKDLNERLYPVQKDNPIWMEYISANSPNMIVLGDYFFMYEPHQKEDRRIFLRDNKVNNMEEYNAKFSTFVRPWQPLEFTYMAEATVFSMVDIIPILKINNQPIATKQSSEINWADLNQHNIIFTGTIKGIGELEKLLPNFQIQIKRDSLYQLERLDDSGNVVEIYPLPRKLPNEMMTDYAFVGKIKGPGNHTVMIIISGDDVGLSSAVKTVTSPEFVNELQTQFPDVSLKTPFYFEMILKVEGLRRSYFDHEIVYFKAHQ